MSQPLSQMELGILERARKRREIPNVSTEETLRYVQQAKQNGREITATEALREIEYHRLAKETQKCRKYDEMVSERSMSVHCPIEEHLREQSRPWHETPLAPIPLKIEKSVRAKKDKPYEEWCEHLFNSRKEFRRELKSKGDDSAHFDGFVEGWPVKAVIPVSDNITYTREIVFADAERQIPISLDEKITISCKDPRSNQSCSVSTPYRDVIIKKARFSLALRPFLTKFYGIAEQDIDQFLKDAATQSEGHAGAQSAEPAIVQSGGHAGAQSEGPAIVQSEGLAIVQSGGLAIVQSAEQDTENA
jgi:hypothetical protein